MKLKHIFSIIVSIVFLSVNLNAQEGADPFVKKDKIKEMESVKKVLSAKGDTVSVVFELFSMPIEEAGKLLRESESDSLKYNYLLEKGKLESMMVLKGRSGQKFSNEGVNELIYPTEYGPSETIHLDDKDTNGGKENAGKVEKTPKISNPKILADVVNSAIPLAFETRNTGQTLEIQPLVNKDNLTCNMIVAVELVSHVGNEKYGPSSYSKAFPIFETQRINTSVTCKFGEPLMLGTMNCPFFIKKGERESHRVWFAMMTVNPVK